MFAGFKYRLTVLNALTSLMCMALFIYALAYWFGLEPGNGWGNLGIMRFGIFGLSGLLLDFMLQFMIKSPRTILYVELAVIATVLLVLAPFIF